MAYKTPVHAESGKQPRETPVIMQNYFPFITQQIHFVISSKAMAFPRRFSQRLTAGLMILAMSVGIEAGIVVSVSQQAFAENPTMTFPKDDLSALKSDSPIAFQQTDTSMTVTDSEVQTLQGNVNALKVTAGRSQIVKFAQPIARLSIADPAKADIIPLAPDQVMINGKERGVTSFIVWDEAGQEGIFDLFIDNDTSEILKAIESIAPNEKIDVKITNDSLILSGQVSNSVILDEIRKTAAGFGYSGDKFVDVTESPVPQVILEVKVAEANRSTSRDLRTGFSTGNTGVTMTRLSNTFRPTNGANGQTPNIPGILPARPVVGNISANNVGGITGTLFSAGSDFNIWYDLLETKGKIITLAEPKLVCTHGRTASFLAGGEFPYVSSIDQNGSPIISFREFGVKLNFTPWIAMRSGRIELNVSPEVSNIDRSSCQVGAGGLQVCGLAKRSTTTTVELKDGESLMVSGILTREDQKTLAKVPFIGDIPILGALFTNSTTSRADRELIVVITPHIVRKGDYGEILSSASQ
ncbi:MAG: pilus assembly protein N-terminal domain-containing protein [Vampirovibrionales bacterium]|nr:pilus assembly protein N-terminal domain-containing protein [Vampirovibrionales bacterium]